MPCRCCCGEVLTDVYCAGGITNFPALKLDFLGIIRKREHVFEGVAAACEESVSIKDDKVEATFERFRSMSNYVVLDYSRKEIKIDRSMLLKDVYGP
jgi:hypothetical protein